MKRSDTEKVEALERLREWVKPGDTVHCILRHVSRSGMYRRISLLREVAPGDWRTLDGNVAAALGLRWSRDKEGVGVSGCGMDMGFHLVYELSHALWPDGFGCVGRHCNSNDHANWDRDFTVHGGGIPEQQHEKPDVGRNHWHRDAGYALRHRWL